MLTVDREVVGVRGISVRRGRRLVLKEFSLVLGAGITVVLGPNGAGKTTLLRSIAFLDPGTTGKIAIDGAEAGRRVGQRRKLFEHTGYMPQAWKFIPGYTAAESVQYASWLKGAPSREIERLADGALRSVGLIERRNTKLRELSGGMRQRVGLAESLVNDPRVLVLDEPTVGLDPEQRLAFRTALLSHSQEAAVVLSTHLTDDASVLADRIVVLLEGRIIFDGTAAEIEAHSDVDDSSTGSRLERGYLQIVRGATIS